MGSPLKLTFTRCGRGVGNKEGLPRQVQIIRIATLVCHSCSQHRSCHRQYGKINIRDKFVYRYFNSETSGCNLASSLVGWPHIFPNVPDFVRRIEMAMSL
jgi:hypothetical protein